MTTLAPDGLRSSDLTLDLGAYAARTATDWDVRAGSASWVAAEGSLAKVDLSGFTRLSERLDRSEATGAEELNAVLNDVFGELIEEVLDRRGDILQFGGDALLIWFEGEGHASRAAASCKAMVQRLAARPPEQTPAGVVRLRMSAAVASGDVVFTVVGRDHRELLTLGPVASRVDQLEKLADSGQVMVDTMTARELPSARVRRAAQDAWLVHGSIPELRSRRSTRAARDAAGFVPPDVRALEALGSPVGEHRHTAVAFVGVTGIDALVAFEDFEGAVQRVAQVADAVDGAVSEFKVTWTATDLMADGAVFLLFAGAPVAREDDEERMLRACRAIADACPDVRIGAHAGRVFAADIGHPDRRTFAIIGDTTNLAARLMMRVDDGGGVLVSRELFDESRCDHRIDWAEPFSVKGRRHPVVAGLLGSRGEPTVERRVHDLPLVGREAERARLSALLDAVAGASTEDGAPLRLALVAEPGVGKSRLVEATVEKSHGRGIEVIRAAATTFEADAPYAALRPALRAALGIGDDDTPPGETVRRLRDRTTAPELLSLLNLPLGLDLGTTAQVEALEPQFVQARRNELVSEVLLSSRSPCLVVVEDLHDLDRASAGLLDVLSHRAEHGRLGLLVTSRTEITEHLADAAGWEVIALQPLGAEHTRSLASAVLGEEALSDIDLERLIEDSGGNPLFLRELVAYSSNALGALPTSAEEVIAARIDTLDPARRRLLRDTAVGGPVQRLVDIATVLDDDRLTRTASWDGLADFVSVHGRDASSAVLRFRHELYRQSAYSGLAVRRRRELHAAYADLLMKSATATDTSTIAVHLHAARRYEEAWDWALRAARTAREAGALADALTLFDRAIDAGRKGERSMTELAAAHEELGDVAELVGEYSTADTAFHAAARHGHSGDVSRRLVKRATVTDRQGRYPLALGLLTRAEHRLVPSQRHPSWEQVDAAARDTWASLMLRRSSVLHRQGRLPAAYDAAQAVADALRDATTDRARGDRARALLRLEMVASEAGWPQRFELGKQALEAFDGLDEDRDLAALLLNLGVTAYEADDWSGAVRRYEQAIEVFRRAGDAVGAAIALNNAADIRLERGEIEEPTKGFTTARRVFRASGHAFYVALTSSALGRLAARTGDLDRARTLLDEACSSLDDLRSDTFADDARVRRLEVEVLADPAGALEAARTLVEQLEERQAASPTVLTAKRYLAVATAAAGDLDAAAKLAHGVRQTAVSEKVAFEESLADDLLAGLAVMRGAAPDTDQLQRRDLLWERLGVVVAPTYPPIPRVAADMSATRQTFPSHGGNGVPRADNLKESWT